ncbi:unnamed protein product [Symbiodinium necroappetens]|uniref:B30.2/SPRY domain-containing protein n=1 Tax=Symbiodinium necroappetens TaxID=1628268 RepID=A0A813AT14_9DINO|nr:unnamed protein product [Symbiodinium necroappetens]
MLLVLQACTFSHILDLEEGPSTAGVFGHPLWKLSPSRRVVVLQEVARSVLQRAYPESHFQDPVPGMSASGFARPLHQAEWDWTMDGRRVECKSSSLSWHKCGCQWRAQFHAVKLAHDGCRQHALFDGLLLVLLSPDCLDIVQHDLRTGVLLSDPCLHATLQKHLAKYPAMASNPYDNLPLSLSSPTSRGLRIQQLALEIDQRLHPDAKFSLGCGGRTVSGRRLSAHNAPVDWVRDEIRVEVKHGKLAFISRAKRWKCTFRGIKCALPGTRPRDLYDELWLVMYSPLGLHFLKNHGRFGLSTSGLSTAVEGHQVQVYGPSQEMDSRALETTGHLAVCQHGAPLLPWLAERLEAEAMDLGSSAALALELLVAGEVIEPVLCFVLHGRIGLRSDFPLQLAASRRHGKGASGTDSVKALKHMNAPRDQGLAEDDSLAAERCHFWANGLVASSSPGWREVAAVARSFGPAAPVQPASATTWREALGWEWWITLVSRRLDFGQALLQAVLAALAADRCWPLHALLAQGLASDGGEVAAPGDVFEAALTAFPKVLPWNIIDWMSWAFEHPGSHMGARSKAQGSWSLTSQKQKNDSLVQELLQYVMKLLPTCERNAGFGELLKAALALALHRRPAEWLRPPPLRAGRCLLADALIRRYGAKHLELCQRLCDELRYPLGVMELLVGCEEPCCDDSSDTLGKINAVLASSRAAQDQAVEVSESRFREVASAVLRSAAARTAEEASEPPVPTPVKSPTPRCAICDMPGCEVQMVRGASPVVRKDGRINAWHDVALALHRLARPRLSSPDEHRWQFVMEAASRAPPGLLAALAALMPGRGATEACLRSIEEEKFSGSGLLSDGTSAAAAAEAQWQTAFGGNWLQLPPEQKSPLPPRPRPQPPPRKQPDVPEGLRKAGSGVQLCISEDGLQARHLDDTGEEMHGVLIGTRPLAHGRAGAYFEVALEEVRPGESPDGLTVGVTTTAPDDVATVPQTAEHIADTWSVGYDGQMWDCKSASLTQVGWDPRSLVEGDIIGVLVTAREGELIVFRNGCRASEG